MRVQDESGAAGDDGLSRLDRYMPASMRQMIERDYYGRVASQARLDKLLSNPAFLEDPARHVGLYSDHGIVHVRDVASNILLVLERIHGVLIPQRDGQRLEAMKAYGVWLAYLHDIGMRDFSAFGRFMHPEFAAQEVFRPHFDETVEALWEDNYGNMAWGFDGLISRGILRGEPQLILREFLSLAAAHSKSKVPMAVLNDPATLRSGMMRILATELPQLALEQRQERALQARDAARIQGDPASIPEMDERLDAATSALEEDRRSRSLARDQGEAREPAGGNDFVVERYRDFESEAFMWLLSPNEEMREIVRDVVHVVRALRAADALRQRGGRLRTSGGYLISVDQRTAEAVYTLRLEGGATFLATGGDRIGAGESNIASSEIGPEGDLWISFQRGAFLDDASTKKAALYAAAIIDDIQRDIVSTFRFEDPDAEGLKPGEEIRIRIEHTDDNLAFADQVAEALGEIDPALRTRTDVMPSLKQVAPEERERYLRASPVAWPEAQRIRALRRIGRSGHDTRAMDPSLAFQGVRLANLRRSEVLIRAGSPAGFVYVSTGAGLLATPRGGYSTFEIRPWSLVGRNALIRGDQRNDTDQALEDGTVLMIPKETYLKHWHRSYELSEIAEVIARFRETDPRAALADVIGAALAVQGAEISDGVLSHDARQLLRAFAEGEGLSLSAAPPATSDPDAASGAEPALDALQRLSSVVDRALVSQPPMLATTRIRDLLRLLAREAIDVSAEARGFWDSIDAAFLGYVRDHAEEAAAQTDLPLQPAYAVYMLPQDAAQSALAARIQPNARSSTRPWGQATLLDTFYHEELAVSMVDALRALPLLAIIDLDPAGQT